MSLPAQGWLPEILNTNGIPLEGLLPEEYIGVYSEGGDGILLGVTELDFLQVAVIFDASFIREHFGYSRSPITGGFEGTLGIELVQSQVFGVLLLDSFTPPRVAEEFFEFPAYTQDACVGGIQATTPMFGLCASGIPIDTVDIEGIVPIFTEES